MTKKVTVEIEFTERELEILRMVCDGKSHKEIAAIFNVSERTSKWYLGRFYAKTALKPLGPGNNSSLTRVTLYKWAIENGLLEPPKRKEQNEISKTVKKVSPRNNVRRFPAA